MAPFFSLLPHGTGTRVSASVRLAILVVACVLSGPLRGDTAHFSRLSVQDGLSASSVESIAEDRYGFIWFGTQEGLNRFDGYSFRAYQASPEPGHLSDGFIRAITPDPNGDLWIGTGSGLQHLDVATLRFGAPVTPAGTGVRLNTLHVAPDGRVWFAGSSGGLWTVAPGGTRTARPAALELISPSTIVDGVALSANGDLLVAVERKLFHLGWSSGDADPRITLKKSIDEVGSVSTMTVDGSFLWLGRYDAAPLRIDLRDGSRTTYPELPPYVLSIVPAGDGGLWIAGKEAGVTKFDPSSGERLVYRHEPGNEDSLAEDDVAVVHEDRGGSLWVGAWNGGLSRLDLHSQAFNTIRYAPGKPDSLPDDDVRRMAESPDGRLWMVTRNDVLAVGDPVTESFRRIPLEGDLTSIAFAGGEPFVGTRTGLLRLDPITGTEVPLDEELRSAGLDRMMIRSLEGQGSHLWILGDGVVYRASTTDGLLRTDLPSGLGRVSSIYSPNEKRLWIALEEGAVVRVTTEQRQLRVQRLGNEHLADRGRLAFITEDDGIVWLGAARGIGRLEPSSGAVEWLDIKRGLPSRSINGIVPDDSGTLWFATERGITRLDPQTLEAVHFGQVQGAQASGYVEGGAARGSSGRIYFAGKGITVFDPARVTDNPHPPNVVFSSLEILHRSVDPSWMDPDSPLSTALHAADTLTLGPEAAVFSVEMAAPGASDPEGVRFAHTLEGFDEGWIETGAERRVATYTRLEPGDYVLRARARASSGAWSENEATLHITILPPWWRTTSAMAVWILLAVLMITLLILDGRRRTRIRIALAEQDILRRTSVTDPLTGLYNRRFLVEWLKREVPRVQRSFRRDPDVQGELLVFVAADLDNLKEINDRFGHDQGDRAIRAVADLLASHARADDVAVRLGGDEFLLILRSVDLEQAIRIVERLRTSVDEFPPEGHDDARSTISLGFAAFPFIENDPDALTWEQSLQLADYALLQSKRRGRNVWTGFVATNTTRATSIREFLSARGEDAPRDVLSIEGPLDGDDQD